MNVLDMVPKHIRELSPYQSARSLHTDGLLLDANENPCGLFGRVNRYPDGSNIRLRTALSEMHDMSPEECAVGNGSDELIDLLFRVFCIPGDRVIIPAPTYGVYSTTAAIHNIASRVIPMTLWQPDVPAIRASIEERTKIIWLCSPNNPVGNLIDPVVVSALLETGRIVVVDEAYAEFSGAASWVRSVRRYPNLIVLRTLSKAFALAGARVGYLFAHPTIVQLIQNIKLPYNINRQTTTAALHAIQHRELVTRFVETTIRERQRVTDTLRHVKGVSHVFESSANFVLFQMDGADSVFRKLLAQGVVIRDRSREPQLVNCLRVTIGTAIQNDQFLDALRRIVGMTTEPQREAHLVRETHETMLDVRVRLDGSGRYFIRTGVRFLDHMLEQFSKHSAVDIDLFADGDLDVDEHHTIEDSAIVLGKAIRSAMGDKRGMERYGFVLPMDESLAFCAIDFSGRPLCIFEGEFTRERVGDLPTEMVPHWFRSFAEHAGATIHIQLKGENDHHKIEAAFKALARTVKQAVARQGIELPSTKGML